MDPVHERGPWTRSIFWWTRSMDRVHGGGPWTRGPCFVLSPQWQIERLQSRSSRSHAARNSSIDHQHQKVFFNSFVRLFNNHWVRILYSDGEYLAYVYILQKHRLLDVRSTCSSDQSQLTCVYLYRHWIALFPTLITRYVELRYRIIQFQFHKF